MNNDNVRDQVAEVLETVARDGLPGPRDLDVALDAILQSVDPGSDDYQVTNDMADIGRALMDTIERNTKDGPLKDWAPMQSPTEIVVDLLNMLHDERAWFPAHTAPPNERVLACFQGTEHLSPHTEIGILRAAGWHNNYGHAFSGPPDGWRPMPEGLRKTQNEHGSKQEQS